MILALLLVAVGLAAVLALYAAICAFVAHRFTTARRVAPVDGASAATPSTAVTLASRGRRVTLHGWYLPAAPGGAAVVFVHGKDSCRGSELRAPTFELAQAHVAAGISVLMIDLRGHGASTRARMTYGAEEKLDVLGAVDWLRQQGHGRVGVLGASMGAASALLAAADDTVIEALVADSAFAHFGAMIERQFRQLVRAAVVLRARCAGAGLVPDGAAPRRRQPARRGGQPDRPAFAGGAQPGRPLCIGR